MCTATGVSELWGYFNPDWVKSATFHFDLSIKANFKRSRTEWLNDFNFLNPAYLLPSS